MQVYWLSVEIGAAMSVVFSSHHRLQFLFVAMACLCVLLGGPSYAAGADSLTIAGQTYDEPGVSGTAGPGPMPTICSLTATQTRPLARTATWW